jgi:hypothetical protein
VTGARAGAGTRGRSCGSESMRISCGMKSSSRMIAIEPMSLLMLCTTPTTRERTCPVPTGAQACVTIVGVPSAGVLAWSTKLVTKGAGRAPWRLHDLPVAKGVEEGLPHAALYAPPPETTGSGSHQ